MLLDAAYFGSVREWRGSYKQHNAALEWFRSTTIGRLSCGDPEAALPLVFNNFERVAVAAIQKGSGLCGNGLTWWFDETHTVCWFWLDMVAQMDQPSIQLVCHGPEGRSRGLVRCEFSQRGLGAAWVDAYGNPQLWAWDFVLIREDGSGIRVHPQWSTTEILTYVERHGGEVEIPLAGLGSSDGPGTYRHYRFLVTGPELRFDATKRPH